jgi:hypothetical protein
MLLHRKFQSFSLNLRDFATILRRDFHVKVLANPFDAATVNHSIISTSDKAYQVLLPKYFSALALEKNVVIFSKIY